MEQTPTESATPAVPQQAPVGDTPPQPTPEAPVTPPETPKEPAKPERFPANPALYQLRKYFVYVIVGGLIISALVAIVAALMDNMSGVIGKSIGTVISIMIHSLVALGFVSITSTKQSNKGSVIVIGTLFGTTVLSLLITTLNTWEVITDAEFVMRTYLMLFTAFMTSLVIYGLYQSNEADKATILSRNTAVGSSVVLFGMLLPVIYGVDSLIDFYFRLIAAASIVVGVSIVITVIFHWYYMSKHPELRSKKQPLTAGKIIGRIALVIIALWFLSIVSAAVVREIGDSTRSDYSQPSRRTPPSDRYY